jgi:hypothetical protein
MIDQNFASRPVGGDGLNESLRGVNTCFPQTYFKQFLDNCVCFAKYATMILDSRTLSDVMRIPYGALSLGKFCVCCKAGKVIGIHSY